MTDKHCPRCGDVRLVAIDIAPVQIHRCTRCGGSFLGTSQWQKLVELAKGGAAPVLEPPDVKPSEEKRDAIGCPVCGKAMTTIEHEGDSKIFVDVCRSDGLWLDGGEIAAVVKREGDAREHREGVDAAKSLAKDLVVNDVTAGVAGGLLELLGEIVVGIF